MTALSGEKGLVSILLAHANSGHKQTGLHGNELDCSVQIEVDVDVCMKHDVPYMVLSMDILFTHLLHVCDDVSHLQTELVILLLLIVKQNHSFWCVYVCGLVCWVRGGECGGGKSLLTTLHIFALVSSY